MKAWVNEDTCIGCEVCVSVCSDVFSMNDNGKSVAITGDIPSDLQDRRGRAGRYRQATLDGSQSRP